jgi:hypothetical protein
MTINEALQIIVENSDYDQDEDVTKKWMEAMATITSGFGVVYDGENWVTSDTGDII